MEVFCGVIAKPDGPIDPRIWAEIIASNPALEPFPDRLLTNPFTQEPILALGDGKAYYVENGKRVGNLGLIDGMITTTGVPRSFCEEVAARLNATFNEADYS